MQLIHRLRRFTQIHALEICGNLRNLRINLFPFCLIGTVLW